jgi:hypothetical protein
VRAPLGNHNVNPWSGSWRVVTRCVSLLDVLLLCAPNSPPKCALHIEQAADGMHDDHRSLSPPEGWTGAPEKHCTSMLAAHILQGPMRTHTSYLKREKQPGGGRR